MKKHIILFLLIAAAITTRAQNQSSGDPIILNTEQTEGGLISSCSGYVLQDGFSYKAEGDESLVLRADPELCSDEDEDDFAYNRNGCMTKDLTKGIRKIEYNALNLPQKIYIKNSKIEAIFEYNYLANGVKVRTVKRWNPETPTAGKEVNEASLTDSLQTDYLGNKIYENGELKTILVDGGYYDCEKEKYFFYLTDHLGNNRVVADEDGNIVETNHYYPFGETFAENTKQDVQPYKYNGKELNKDLNLYDYSARHYAPNIGRFTTMDPLAEKYYNISPYAYVLNNPMKYIDPNGDSVRVHIETIDKGHAWISTGEGDNLKIYSYGPHNKGKKDLASKGVLTVYTGDDTKSYMKGKIAGTDVVSFVINDITDEQMDDAVSSVVSNAISKRESEANTETGTKTDYYIDAYIPFANNCTTFASKMLHESGSKVLGKEITYIPLNMGGVRSESNKSFIKPTNLKTYLLNSFPSIVTPSPSINIIK